MTSRVLWFCVLSTVAFATNHTISENYPPWNETWTDKLKQHLLTNYDRFARPSQHYNTTTVHVSIRVVSVEVNDMENIMTAKAFFLRVWNDDKLSWNASDYEGIQSLRVAPHQIWLPDIYLLNSAKHGMENYFDSNCLLYEDGDILLVTPTIFHSYCRLDFTYWPFEMQTCSLRLSSWTYDGSQVNLTLYNGRGFDTYEYVPMNEWVLRNVSVHLTKNIYENSREPNEMMDYVFVISRSSELYYHIIFIPTIPIVFLSLITFWLQPQSQMKFIINGSSIFAVVLYLIYFGYKVPPRCDSMPLIVKFYSACLYQATISLIISTFVINIKNIGYCTAIPRLIRRFLLGKPGHYLGLGYIIREIDSQKAEHEMSDNRTSISMSTNLLNPSNTQQTLPVPASRRNVINLEWILLATAIDRLVFLLFCFTFILMAISYVRIDRFTSDSD